MLTQLGAIDWGALARAIHVLAVVVWIGGVWLVTTVILPAMKAKPPEVWVPDLEIIERRFASQARIAVLLVLLSGLYMLHRYDLWDRFARGKYWWMHLMVGVWILFAALLFLIEPFVHRRIAHRRSGRTPKAALARMLWLHRIMLGLSLLAILAAVAGSHGFL